jgi:signal transduction histidine kinase
MDDLKPAAVELFGISESLESLVTKAVEHSGMDVQVELNFEPLPEEPSAFVRITLYRIFQEAAHNALKHGGSVGKLRLTIKNGSEGVCFSLDDDGKGFEVESEMQRISERTDYGGNGLLNMMHRAKTIGANISWDKSDLGGTRVFVSLGKERFAEMSA